MRLLDSIGSACLEAEYIGRASTGNAGHCLENDKALAPAVVSNMNGFLW